jgi:DNA-binding NarL/FixJ family response regulator
MNPIRVFLADDHGIVRAGIRAVLTAIGGIEVIGEACDGRQALERIAADPPDLLLTDLSMPELNGFELTARVVHDHPSVRVIVLSMHASEEYVWQALNAGASGYLLKNADANEMAAAIQAVRSGSVYLSSAISPSVLENYRSRLGPAADAINVLTRRQREVLQLITEGHALKEIAGKLGLSVKTVESQRMQLMERLGIFDTPGLVRYALRTGVIFPDA